MSSTERTFAKGFSAIEMKKSNTITFANKNYLQ